VIDLSNPYDAPKAAEEAPAPKRDHFASLKFCGAAFLGFWVTLGVMAATNTTAVGVVGFGATTLLALLGVGYGVRSAALAKGGTSVANALLALVNLLFAAFGAFVTLWAQVGFRRGRQLRRFGRVLLPPVVESREWSALPTSLVLAHDDAQALAAQWRDNGRTEHASVAAFARLTLDLMALGAPPDLIAAANRDSLDEIRHTEMCFSLARALDGRTEGPGPFPEASRAATLPRPRTFALAKLAVDSLIDGALHEGVSARIIAKLAKRCEVPEIRAALKEIAADEGRHAAHGWDVVMWCVAEGGEPVLAALESAASSLAETLRSPLPEAARDGGWERFGIHGHALEADEYAKARADLVKRVEELARACATSRLAG
jgi:hypothetical protein